MYTQFALNLQWYTIVHPVSVRCHDHGGWMSVEGEAATAVDAKWLLTAGNDARHAASSIFAIILKENK